jgi:hypothetical protein
MAKASPAADKCINRRIVLKAGAALAASGPALLRGGHAEAQPRANRPTALFAYVGAFTTPERKGHGGGINVYRVDPTSGAWTHEQLLEIVNPSFLTLDRAQRFLYSVHADLEEISAYAIDKQNGHITALNRQSCGGKNAVHLSIDPTDRWIVTANYSAGTVGVVPIEKDGTWGHAAIWSACPANQARIANSRPARIPTRPFLIRAAGSSLCPTRDLTGSSSFASTRRAGNSCRTTHPSSPRERAPAPGTLRFIRKCHSRM